MLSAGAEAHGLSPAVWYLGLECLGQTNSSLECESLFKEVVVGVGSGLVGLLFESTFLGERRDPQELATPERGSRSRLSKAQDVEVSEQKITDKVNTQQWGRTNVRGPGAPI